MQISTHRGIAVPHYHTFVLLGHLLSFVLRLVIEHVVQDGRFTLSRIIPQAGLLDGIFSCLRQLPAATFEFMLSSRVELYPELPKFHGYPPRAFCARSYSMYPRICASFFFGSFQTPASFIA